jgi:CheY-like chemotaxis protein
LPEFAAFDATLLRKCLVRLLTRSGPATEAPVPATLALDRPAPALLRLLVLPSRALVPGDGAGQQTGSRQALSEELTDRLLSSLQGRVRRAAAGDDGAGALTLELPVDWLPPLPSPEAVAARRRLSALVVDDVATNRLVVRHMLGLLGVGAAEAGSGPDAIAALEQAGGSARPFDLVLLDMNMPGMDGEDTFRAIRAGPSPVPVIALTADATGERRQYYAGIGIDGFVAKPVEQSVLWAEIVTTLGLTA